MNRTMERVAYTVCGSLLMGLGPLFYLWGVLQGRSEPGPASIFPALLPALGGFMFMSYAAKGVDPKSIKPRAALVPILVILCMTVLAVICVSVLQNLLSSSK